MKLLMSLVLLLALAAPSLGWASCADDLKPLEQRIKMRPTGDVALASKELRKAQDAQSYSETSCLNAVIRARRALDQPMPAKPLTPGLQPRAY